MDKPVSYKLAKLAKERGYKIDKPSTDYVPMYIDGDLSEGQEEDYTRDSFCLAMTISELHAFLRDKLGVLVQVYNNASGYLWAISKVPGGTDLGWSDHSGNCEYSGAFVEYDDALGHALEWCLTKTLEDFRKDTNNSHWGLYSDYLREIFKNEKEKTD